MNIICTKCKIEKLSEYFYFRKDRNCYHSWCKSCMATVGHDRYRERKRKLIALFGGECVKCGYHKNINCLDFHHVNPEEKEFSFSEHKQKKWDSLLEELKKCILLCRNCHGELHWPVNGTVDLAVDTLLAGPAKTGKCRHCDEDVYGTVYCSRSCVYLSRRKVERPNAEELKKELSTQSMVKVAAKYGVSDNSVRKWIKIYGL